MPETPLLDWLTPEQQAQLAALTPVWDSWIVTELDEVWPDWRDAADYERGAFIDHLILTFTQPVGANADNGTPFPDGVDADLPTQSQPTGSEVTDLSWVTVAQRESLERQTASRGQWPVWLPAELDAAWPQWPAATGEVLASWLDSLIPTLAEATATLQDPDERTLNPAATSDAVPDLTTGGAAAQIPDTAAPDLDWITSEQAVRLDAFTDQRGDWREWLPLELWTFGEWTASRPEDLVPWLDQLIPAFGESQQPLDPSSASGGSALSENPDLVLVESLAHALAGDDEMLEVARSLSSEEIADILREALSMIGGHVESPGHA